MSKHIHKMFVWIGYIFLGHVLQAEAQSSPDTTLLRIIRSGDIAVLQQKLDSGADANAANGGFTALMAATLCGSVDQMRMLLDHGANPNATDGDSITALWLALPDTAKTMLLLNRGANPALLSKEHYNCLVKLVNFAGTTPLFQQLVSRGADPKGGVSGNDNILLYIAAGTDDTVLLNFLLSMGLRPNDTTSFGDYPINAAVNYRCFETIRLLVEHGANVNVYLPNTTLPNLYGMTPLMVAAESDDERDFFYLLDHGADVRAKSATGYTALHYVLLAETDHPNMTRALLDRGASPTQTATDGSSPRSLSANKGNTASFQLLNQKN